ncbi:MAG: hypothetical protein JXA57_10960 [Armatimonadetes bacterium]|nr:hypothetical protein [Armatimonadota bacterium]
MMPDDDGYRVRFATAKGRELAPNGVVLAADYWNYQYAVQAEAKDWLGDISWTQPIFFDQPRSVIEIWLDASASRGMHAAADPLLVADSAGPHLEVRTAHP